MDKISIDLEILNIMVHKCFLEEVRINSKSSTSDIFRYLYLNIFKTSLCIIFMIISIIIFSLLASQLLINSLINKNAMILFIIYGDLFFTIVPLILLYLDIKRFRHSCYMDKYTTLTNILDICSQDKETVSLKISNSKEKFPLELITKFIYYQINNNTNYYKYYNISQNSENLINIIISFNKGEFK